MRNVHTCTPLYCFIQQLAIVSAHALIFVFIVYYSPLLSVHSPFTPTAFACPSQSSCVHVCGVPLMVPLRLFLIVIVVVVVVRQKTFYPSERGRRKEKYPLHNWKLTHGGHRSLSTFNSIISLNFLTVVAWSSPHIINKNASTSHKIPHHMATSRSSHTSKSSFTPTKHRIKRSLRPTRKPLG